MLFSFNWEKSREANQALSLTYKSTCRILHGYDTNMYFPQNTLYL